ncbi:MAG: hypothetical protein WCQ53_04580, partial [bacterium]
MTTRNTSKLLIIMLFFAMFPLAAMAQTPAEELKMMHGIVSTLRTSLKDARSKESFDKVVAILDVECKKYYDMSEVLSTEIPEESTPKDLEKIDKKLKAKYGYDTYSVALQFDKIKRIFRNDLMSIAYVDYERADLKDKAKPEFKGDDAPLSERLANLKASIANYNKFLEDKEKKISKDRDKISKQARSYLRSYNKEGVEQGETAEKILPKLTLLNYILQEEVMQAMLIEYQAQDVQIEKNNIKDAEKFIDKFADNTTVTEDDQKLLNYMELTYTIKEGYSGKFGSMLEKIKSPKLKATVKYAGIGGQYLVGGIKNYGVSSLNTYFAIAIKDFMYVLATKAGMGNQLPKKVERMYRNVGIGEFWPQMWDRFFNLDTQKVFGVFVATDMIGRVVINNMVDGFSWLAKKSIYRNTGVGLGFRGTMNIVKGVGGYIIPLAVADRLSQYYGEKNRLSYELDSSNPEIQKMAQNIIDTEFPGLDYEVRESLSFAISFGISHAIYTSIERGLKYKQLFGNYNNIKELSEKMRQQKCDEMRKEIEETLWRIDKTRYASFKAGNILVKFGRDAGVTALNFLTAEIIEDRIVSKFMFSQYEREDMEKKVMKANSLLVDFELNTMIDEMIASDASLGALTDIYDKYDDSDLMVIFTDSFRKNSTAVQGCLKIRKTNGGVKGAKECLNTMAKSSDPYNYEWWHAMLLYSNDPKVRATALDKMSAIVNDPKYKEQTETDYKNMIDAQKEEIAWQERNPDETLNKTNFKITKAEFKEQLKEDKATLDGLDTKVLADRKVTYEQMTTAYEGFIMYME